MFILKRIPEKEDTYSSEFPNDMKIIMSCEDDANLDQLLDFFRKFLLANGYIIPENKQLCILSDHLIEEAEEKEYDEENMKEVEVDLDEETISKLALIAHDRNITLNRLCNDLLDDYIKVNADIEKIDADNIIVKEVSQDNIICMEIDKNKDEIDINDFSNEQLNKLIKIGLYQNIIKVTSKDNIEHASDILIEENKYEDKNTRFSDIGNIKVPTGIKKEEWEDIDPEEHGTVRLG